MLLDIEGMALARGALRIQGEQLGSRIAHLLRRPRFCLVPLPAAQLVQRSLFGLRAGIARDDSELRDGDIQPVGAFILEEQEFGRAFSEV